MTKWFKVTLLTPAAYAEEAAAVFLPDPISECGTAMSKSHHVDVYKDSSGGFVVADGYRNP